MSKLSNNIDKETVLVLLESQAEFTKVLTELTNLMRETQQATFEIQEHLNSKDGLNKQLLEAHATITSKVILDNQSQMNLLFYKLLGSATILAVILTVILSLTQATRDKTEIDKEIMKFKSELIETVKTMKGNQ